MPSWISIYCRRSIASITAAQLLDGIRGRDAAALAGIDYDTLAEDYDLDEDAVDAALAALVVTRDGDTFAVSYGPARPIFVRRWKDATVHVEESIERRPPSTALAARLRSAVEAIGIELGASQLTEFGVVLGYEIARYLAQKGDGVIVDLQDRYVAVDGGAFQDLA